MVLLSAGVAVFVADYASGGGNIGNSTINTGPNLSGSGYGGPVTGSPYTYWSNDPCPDPNGWAEPDPPACNAVTVLGWQPLYSMFNIESITSDFTNPYVTAAKLSCQTIC